MAITAVESRQIRMLQEDLEKAAVAKALSEEHYRRCYAAFTDYVRSLESKS